MELAQQVAAGVLREVDGGINRPLDWPLIGVTLALCLALWLALWLTDTRSERW